MAERDDENREHWERVYARNTPDQVSWYEADPINSLELIGACHLSRDASIVDIGGGASNLPRLLIDRDFHKIYVLDIAGTAIAAAKQALGTRANTIGWMCADVTRWQSDLSFDCWHDRAVFHFLTDPADRHRYIDVLRRTLKPGGFVVIASFALDGSERCSDLPVMRYAPDDLAVMLQPDFILLDHRAHEHRTPSGLTPILFI